MCSINKYLFNVEKYLYQIERYIPYIYKYIHIIVLIDFVLKILHKLFDKSF